MLSAVVCLSDLICWHLSAQWPFRQKVKNTPTGREADKRGLGKIDGQLSERERKLREREQTLQKTAVHWSQQWRGRQRAVVGKEYCHIHRLESTYEETHTWIQ